MRDVHYEPEARLRQAAELGEANKGRPSNPSQQQGQVGPAECTAAQRCRSLAESAQSHSIRQMLLERARSYEKDARTFLCSGAAE
jgi:hypothetical protein